MTFSKVFTARFSDHHTSEIKGSKFARARHGFWQRRELQGSRRMMSIEPNGHIVVDSSVDREPLGLADIGGCTFSDITCRIRLEMTSLQLGLNRSRKRAAVSTDHIVDGYRDQFSNVVSKMVHDLNLLQSRLTGYSRVYEHACNGNTVCHVKKSACSPSLDGSGPGPPGVSSVAGGDLRIDAGIAASLIEEKQEMSGSHVQVANDRLPDEPVASDVQGFGAGFCEYIRTLRAARLLSKAGALQT